LVGQEFNNWLKDPHRRTLVMGVLNVTPDSFSDGGRFADPAPALEAALHMAGTGADLIDIGGESTRPGATPVEPSEQIRRIVPVISAIRKQSAITISVDTTNWQVAQAALDAGAELVNDISAGREDSDMLPQVARRGVPVILMQMQGTPLTMQNAPQYARVTAEVAEFLTQRAAAAASVGIDRGKILIDPGVGFGKTAEHSLTLLRDLSVLVALGYPVVVGTSRKSFIGKVLGEPDPLKRYWGDAATNSWVVANGAAVVRVHDVGAMAQVVRTTNAIMRGRLPTA
jgi:dihydropteroate synthase